MSAANTTMIRAMVLLALALLVTACGGVLNPPPPRLPTATPDSLASTPLPTQQATPTEAPVPEAWVKNHKLTEMWSGPQGDPGVISFGTTSSLFCSFRVDRPQDNVRVLVYNPYSNDRFWIDSNAVGPVEMPPVHRPGPKPAGVNCAEQIYDLPPVAMAAATATRAPAAIGTVTPDATPAALSEPQAGQPLVLALYYPWYDLTTWESGQTSDLPQEPYGSADPATVARQVGWARDAGIDVLVSAWFGPRDGNPTETNFKTLLTEADRAGIRAALLLETDNDEFFPSREATATALRHFLSVHATQPGYLRVDGRPVILVWNPKSIYAKDGGRVNAKTAAAVDDWASLIDEVDPQRRALWIAEGDFFDLLRVFDGIFPYSVAWSPNPAQQLASYAQTVRARATALATKKVWAATAMPGYDDTRIEGRTPTFAVGRQDGDYYQRTFQGAIDSRPDWIVITSFNEWLEGTQIEPSRAYGRQYLDLTRTLADRFKRDAANR